MIRSIKKTLVLIIMILSLTAILYVKADSGWDTDYGGGWSISDSSSNSSSSYDSDTDGEYTLMGFLLAVVIVGVLFGFSFIQFHFQDKRDKKKTLKEMEVSDELFNKYYNISKSDLKDILYNIYLQIESAKVNYDYNTLKLLCTDNLYNKYLNELNDLKLNGYRNVVDDFKKDLIIIKNITNDNDSLKIDCRFCFFNVNYTLNQQNDIMSGSKNRMYHLFDLTFIKVNDNYYLDSVDDFIKDDSEYFHIDEKYNSTNKMCMDYLGLTYDKLMDEVKNNFEKIQISWMNFDYATLRELCTDELYNQYKTLLDTLKLKNEQNVMSDFFYPVSKIDRIEEINGIIELDVMLCAEFKDYVINTSSNKVVRGNKRHIIGNTYELTYIVEKNPITKCPKCGANVEEISNNVCTYCRSKVIQTGSKLVLSKKKIYK